MPENLLTVQQVAQILSISRSYVYFLARVGELLRDPDRAKAHRVANVMLQMHKIVMADLEAAYKG